MPDLFDLRALRGRAWLLLGLALALGVTAGCRTGHAPVPMPGDLEPPTEPAPLVMPPGAPEEVGPAPEAPVAPARAKSRKAPAPAPVAAEEKPSSTDEALMAAAKALTSEAAEYRIQPGDAVAIDVYREPDLCGEFKIERDGTVAFPLLGKIELSGLTVKEAEKSLTQKLGKDYLVSPKVTIQLRQSVAHRVIVLGEVKAPGVYDIPSGETFTLLQAIAKAGGFSDIAALDRVRIVRIENNEEQSIRVRVSDILKGRAGARDVELRPNDVITVPETVF